MLQFYLHVNQYLNRDFMTQSAITQNNDTNLRRSIIVGLATGFGLAISFVLGIVVGTQVQISPVLASRIDLDPNMDYPLLSEVQTLLDHHYLREQPDHTQREYAMIRGLLSSLNDRYTFFVEPPVAQSESDVLAGTYGGIGVQIQRSEAGELLIFPFPDSSASREGIQDGDILLAVNGNPVDFSMQQDAIDQMLRGEVKDNNGVEITVLRRTNEEDIEFTRFIPFDVVNIPSVVTRVLPGNPKIGYIQILRFTSRTPEELRSVLDDFDEQNISGIVLDLRDNNGGLLQESVQVAGMFVGARTILYEETNNGERAFDAHPDRPAINIPLAVLVNNGTASAAELVAGAIVDYELGVLIGQTTFGKGTVQQIFRLSDNSSLHVTSAEWFTPNRTRLDDVGLEPTIAMIPDENGRDVELGEAVRYLQSQIENNS